MKSKKKKRRRIFSTFYLEGLRSEFLVKKKLQFSQKRMCDSCLEAETISRAFSTRLRQGGTLFIFYKNERVLPKSVRFQILFIFYSS